MRVVVVGWAQCSRTTVWRRWLDQTVRCTRNDPQTFSRPLDLLSHTVRPLPYSELNPGSSPIEEKRRLVLLRKPSLPPPTSRCPPLPHFSQSTRLSCLWAFHPSSKQTFTNDIFMNSVPISDAVFRVCVCECASFSRSPSELHAYNQCAIISDECHEYEYDTPANATDAAHAADATTSFLDFYAAWTSSLALPT